jgi:hypothetical protein
MSNEHFAGMTSADWSPGMEATFIDHLIVRPHTSWRGVRGANAAFGAEDEFDDAFDDEDLDMDEIEEELDMIEKDSFGRLYMSPEFHKLEKASAGDMGALIARSGGSGYRGGRPSFGAKLDVSHQGISFTGSEIAAVALGLGFLLVAARS